MTDPIDTELAADRIHAERMHYAASATAVYPTDEELAEEQDAGPRMLQTLFRLALLFGAVVLTIAALVYIAKH